MLLLVLLMGGGSALGAEKEYVEALSLNFENESSYKDGWTTSGTISRNSVSGSNYLHLYNDASAVYTFPASITKASEFILEFDANVGQCNGNAASGTFVQVKSASGVIFQSDKTKVGWSSKFNISAGEKTLNSAELTGDGYVKTGNFTFMYHYKLVGTSDGVKLTVTNKKDNTVVVDGTEVSSTIVFPTSIAVAAPKNAAAAGIDNIVIQIYSESEVVPNPSASIIAVNKNQRTIQLELGNNSSEGSTIYYYTKDDKSDLSKYTQPIVLQENTTLHYYTLSAKGNTSDEQSLEVNCSEITLNTPSYSKVGYNDGVSTVNLFTNVENILLNPKAKIHYEKSNKESGDINNGETITVEDGVTVKAYAMADGYGQSDELVFTAIVPCTAPVCYEEIFKGRESTDKLGLSLSEEAVIDGFYKIYYNINDEQKLVSERLLMNAVTSNDLFRPNGLYLGSGHTFALLDVKKGDYVTIKGMYGNGNFSITSSANGEKDAWNSVDGSTYCFVITNDGQFKFNMGRYGYMQSITIQRASDVLPLSTAADYTLSTYAPATDVDLTNEDGVEFYAAKVNGTSVALTKVEGKVKAGTGLLVKNTKSVESVTLAIATDGQTVADNELVGVTADMTAADFEGKNAYILVSDTQFQKIGSGTEGTLAKGKAYLLAGTTAAARLLTIGNPTAINGVAEKAAEGADTIYNMQGMRVDNAAASGLYIINGKKYIKK